MRHLTLQPLDPDSFARFGDVIDSEVPCERIAINDDRTWRHHALAQVDRGDANGEAAISLFRAQPVDATFTLQRMERHPLGSQAFINLSGNPYAIVVAPAGELNEGEIRGFIATGQQGVNYRRGVWHHYLLALGGASDFVVIDRIGPGENCDEQVLETPLLLDISS